VEQETRRLFRKKTGLGSALAAGRFLNWNPPVQPQGLPYHREGINR
jgi:hypothetical protein